MHALLWLPALQMRNGGSARLCWMLRGSVAAFRMPVGVAFASLEWVPGFAECRRRLPAIGLGLMEGSRVGKIIRAGSHLIVSASHEISGPSCVMSCGSRAIPGASRVIHGASQEIAAVSHVIPFVSREIRDASREISGLSREMCGVSCDHTWRISRDRAGIIASFRTYLARYSQCRCMIPGVSSPDRRDITRDTVRISRDAREIIR
jgi:hypothetical protein